MADEEEIQKITRLTELQMDMLFNQAVQLQSLSENAENAYISMAYSGRSIAATNLIIAHMLRAELTPEKLEKSE